MEREQLNPENIKLMKLPPMKVRRVLLLLMSNYPPHGIFDIVEKNTTLLSQKSMRDRTYDCHAAILSAHSIKDNKNQKNKKIDEDTQDDEKIFNVK